MAIICKPKKYIRNQYFEKANGDHYTRKVYVTRVSTTICLWSMDKTPDITIIARMSDGTTWYARMGGTMAFLTYHNVRHHTHVENVRDLDVFSLAHGKITLDNFAELIAD